MDTRECEHCGGLLPRASRVDARYCGGTCRVAALRARRTSTRPSPVLPPDLTGEPRWVRYSPNKIPLRADIGGTASSTDPSTWCSYQQALDSRFGVGPGFVLDGDGIVCIDLDDCLTGGQLAPWAERIVAAAGRTYIEVSPSRCGIHVWGRAVLAAGRVVSTPGGGSAEVYPSGRYITVTRRPFNDAPPVLGDISGLVAALTS